jgi:dipeptidase E
MMMIIAILALLSVYPRSSLKLIKVLQSLKIRQASYILYHPVTDMKGCFVGSGSEGLQQAEVCAQILALTGKAPAEVTVLYLGTATYDLLPPRHNQTVRLQEAGCTITSLEASGAPGQTQTEKTDYARLCEAADVIVVSGGNTLWAMDRWAAVGLLPLLRAAAERGAVLTGGSAGAICWFEAGHSDSMDADTYKGAMLAEAAAAAAGGAEGKDEASAAPEAGAEVKAWEYIRCPCLGFFPGLVCPHADKVQSNGVLRATDFDAMLLRHSGERGICIDHFAALCVDGDRYWVLSLPGRPGSVLPDGSFSPVREGVPGVWVKDVEEGIVKTVLLPQTGPLDALLRPAAETEIFQDPRLPACRAANPQ